VESRQCLLPDDGWMWSYPGGKSEIIYMHFTHANTLTDIFPTLGKLAIPLFRLSIAQSPSGSGINLSI
jgi:hypothetical protein